MRKLILPSVLLAGGLLVAFSGAAVAKDTYSTIKGKFNEEPRVSSFTGECVKTRWSNLFDPCMGTPPPPQPLLAAVPAFRTVVHKDMRTVHFEFDDETLTPSARRKLDQLASTLKNAKDIQSAEIVGQADKMGEEGHNNALSMRRAKAVENYLNSRGYLNTAVTQVSGVGSAEARMNCDANQALSERIACNAEDRKTVINVVYYKDELIQ
jgi:outer membrane protein OmpA-like peptidoglycan-associated protein